MTKFNSFKDTSTDAILEKISKVDPSVKTEVLKDGNKDAIETKTQTLTEAAGKLSERLYKAGENQQNADGAQADGDAKGEGKDQASKKDENVVDAEFEEVKDKDSGDDKSK